MSNTTTDLRTCVTGDEHRTQVIEPREVPLGGPRAMIVNRTLPQRARSLIGPWCFVDHFGPADVSATGGMAVPRHPHTGLATVTLLFSGEIDHLDSTGFGNTVRPGEVNLMIAGKGVSHSEFSTASTTVLHGVQLWYALPEALRFGEPGSQHHTAVPVDFGAATLTVFIGSLGAGGSPIDPRTPALAAQFDIPAGESVVVPLDPESEHGFLVDAGSATITATRTVPPTHDDDAVRLSTRQLGFVPTGTRAVTLSAGSEATRVVLVGGPPFGEQIVMWWNFIGRSHAEVEEFRARWQTEIGADPGARTGEDSPGELPDGSLFGDFPTDTPDALPAPALPNVSLRPRR